MSGTSATLHGIAFAGTAEYERLDIARIKLLIILLQAIEAVVILASVVPQKKGRKQRHKRKRASGENAGPPYFAGDPRTGVTATSSLWSLPFYSAHVGRVGSCFLRKFEQASLRDHISPYLINSKIIAFINCFQVFHFVKIECG
jgi:hypothetical protein